MLTVTSVLTLLFFVLFKYHAFLFRWINFQRERVGYDQQLNKYLYPISQISLIFYAITIATIDSTGTGLLHTVSAVIFFIVFFVMVIVLTLYLGDLRSYDTTVMGSTSWLFKKITCVYLVLVWVFCLIGILYQFFVLDDFTSETYIIIVEWNQFIAVLLWLLGFKLDWKNTYLCLIHKNGRSIQFEIEVNN